MELNYIVIVIITIIGISIPIYICCFAVLRTHCAGFFHVQPKYNKNSASPETQIKVILSRVKLVINVVRALPSSIDESK